MIGYAVLPWYRELADLAPSPDNRYLHLPGRDARNQAMANVTRDQLIEAAKLVPPSSLVSEGELLAFATGLSAFLEHGSDLVAALEDDNPALAIATLYNPEPDGPVLAGTDAPVPEPAPGEVPPA